MKKIVLVVALLLIFGFIIAGAIFAENYGEPCKDGKVCGCPTAPKSSANLLTNPSFEIIKIE